MAAVAVASSGGANLAASYAAVQSSLRKQFYGDLVDLRGALLNTMNLAPHRAANLHPKMTLIDSALTMIEESKTCVSNTEMAQLMNMSAKVARAVEAWRSRKPPPQAAGAPAARLSTPFGFPEAQATPQLGGDRAAAERAAGGGAGAPAVLAGGIKGLDRFDALSRLVSGAPSPARRNSAALLPDIDWEVPEIKASGNLDALLPGEASEVLLQQQRAAARASRAGRMSSAEAFLAHISAHADDVPLPGGGGAAHSQQAQQYYRGGLSPLHDPGSGMGLTSPRSATTSTQAGHAAAQQASSLTSAGGALSAGGAAAPAHSASPAPGQHYGLEQGQYGALLQARGQQQAGSAASLAAMLGHAPGAGYAALAQQQQQQQQAALQRAGSIGFGFGNGNSLPLSQASRASAAPQGTLGGMQQQLGDPVFSPLSAASQARAPHSSYHQQQRLQQLAAQQQAAALAGGGRASPFAAPAMQHGGLQPYPSTLHAATGLGQLMGGSESGNYAAQLAAAQAHPQLLYDAQQQQQQQQLAAQQRQQQQQQQQLLQHHHHALLQQQQAAAQPVHSHPLSPGQPAAGAVVSSSGNFSGVPMSNAGSMGGLTITTGTHQILIAPAPGSGGPHRAGAPHPGGFAAGYGEDAAAAAAHHLRAYHQRTPSPFGGSGGRRSGGDFGLQEMSTGSMGSPQSSQKRKRG